MMDKRAPYQQIDPDSREPRTGTVILAGMFAISGAVVGFLLAGTPVAAGGLFVFAVLAAWLGWVARGVA